MDQKPELNEEDNLQKVKNIVRRSENPHPITIVIIIIISMYIIYYIYHKCIKTNLSGIWTDKFNE